MMKTGIKWTLILVLTLTLGVLAACSSDDAATDGDSPDGDTPDGDTDGDTPDGDEPDGDTDGDTPDGDEPGIAKRLHIHLDHDENFLPLDEDYVLHVAGRRIALTRHTDETRAQHPDIFGEDSPLNSNDHPTHYADVDGLPTDRVLRMHITQRSDNEGSIAAAHGNQVDHGLGFPFIHIPDDARARVIAKSPRLRAKYARTGAFKDTNGDINTDLFNTYTPLDIAKTIVFHHPNITNLDADDAANIMMNYIDDAPGLNDLAYAIKGMGRHGWYEMEAVKNDDGSDHTFTNGGVMYKYIIKDEILDAAGPVVQYVLAQVNNDETLKGDSYHPTAGVSHLDVSGEATATKSRDGAYTFRLGETGFHHGFRTRIASSDGNNVELKFRNDWIRHLGVYAQFFDENDNQLSLSESEWTGNMSWLTDTTIRAWLDTDNQKFLSLSSAVPTIFSVPITGDYTETNVTFDWPDAARYAKIRAGGLGHGGTYDKSLTLVGGVLTGVFDIGVPTLLLGIAIGMPDGGEALNKIMSRTILASAIVQFFFSTIWSSSDMNADTILKQVGRALADFLASEAGQVIAEIIIEYTIEQELEESMPFAGWALAAANIATTASMLAQASAEVASSPWIIENRLYPSHDIKVTINHDVNDYQFPATATNFRVVAVFSGSDSRIIEQDLPGTTVSDPIEVWFTDVPAGGSVTIRTGFYSDTNWLAGQGTGTFVNMNSDNVEYLDASITIKENLVPLDEDSVYTQKEKLGIENGAHVWIADTTPIDATRMDLDTAEEGNALSGLVNISVNQRTGDVGYVWRAYSSAVTSCGAGGTGQLYVYQNISATEHPDSNYKFSGCGYADKPYMFYSLGIDDDLEYGRSLNLDLEEQNFVLLPEDDQWLYVRHVSLASGEDFQVDHTKSYCKFPLRLDSAVVHPKGYIVGINHSSSRLFTCKLSDDPVDDADAPVAVMAAGQLLGTDQIATNPALLASPVAMALGPEGSILVLDDISGITTDNVKAVIRAFNPDGTPLAYFGNELCNCDEGYVINPDDPSSCYDPDDTDHNGPSGICGGHGSYDTGAFVLYLQPETADITYLDLAVEHKGYIYVLAYGSDGSKTTDYVMDLYEPNGDWLVRTPEIPAGKLTVDLWRNIYTLNYEMLVGPDSQTEPSISEWIPPTPEVDGDAD